MQTTTYDCGLWVLAGIAAGLRGRHFTGLSEADMRTFRRRLFHIVSDLPYAHEN
jgi:Ulp1 family protease